MPIICRLSGRENLKVLASAIGEPAAPKDKKEKLAEIIDNAQTDIASLCNEKGCNIPTHPTFPDIISGLNKVTHFLQSAQISNLSVQVGFSEPGKMILSWKNPAMDKNYSGVMIRYKAGSYPASQTDGTLIYDSNGTLPVGETATVTGLSDGTVYYIRGFAYAISGASRIYTTSTTGAQCTAIPGQLKGKQVFTASSIFTVPYGVTSVDVFLVGGGGSSSYNYSPGIGAPGGFTKTVKNVSVTPGQRISVTVGASTGTTNFGTYCADGGKHVGGYPVNGTEAPDKWSNLYPSAIGDGVYGGSGGGTFTLGMNNINGQGDGVQGSRDGGTTPAYRGRGGSMIQMRGQGTTTRAFGEASGRLYSSGGNNIVYNKYKSINGTPNTGDGAGGNWSDNSTSWPATLGGSGIVIVRWGY